MRRPWVHFVLLLLLIPRAEAESGQRLVVSVSPRLAPLAGQLSSAFAAQQPGVVFHIQEAEYEQALQALIDGSTHLLIHGRTLSLDDLIRARRQLGCDLVAVPIALDSVSLWVHDQNPVPVLTMEQVRRLLSPEPVSWPELGGAGKVVRIYCPSMESDTMQVARARLLGKKALSQSRTELADRNLVFEALVKDVNGIGITDGTATCPGDVRPVPVALSPGASPRLPTAENLQLRDYPLTHFVYCIFPERQAPDVRPFIGFVTGSPGQELIRRPAAGPAPLPLR